jgi:LCP family protein required for cell wall assembly
MSMFGGGDQLRSGGCGPHERRASHAVAWVAAGIAVLLVAGVLTGYAAFREVLGNIHQMPITGLGARPPRYNNSLNILVIGSDSRQGKNARFGHISGQRSDTILLLHLSPGLKRATVVSIPRDSVVPVFACPQVPGFSGQTSQPGQIEQINATFAFGGPGCLWKTIEHTAHIRLDHFMELNFVGFEHVINDLGGVNICLPFAIHDIRSTLQLSPGLHHVWGAMALAYWRVRYIGVGSDLERIQRDQFLMASMAQEVKHADLLGNPGRLFSVVSDMASSLTTDSGLSQGALISLARGLRTMSLGAVRFIQVPVLPYPQNPNWVEWAPQASSLFSALAHDRRLPRAHRSARHASKQVQAKQADSRTGLAARSQVSQLTGHDGGITARENVCHDAGAFTGPLGGH